jgi:NitT/TauT family transport system ATP-binding protein/nitrate/nitrite transport system substrate-binding protein
MQLWGRAPAGLEGVATRIYRPDLFLRAGGEARDIAEPPANANFD